jgi:hypothetical protein
MKSTNFNYSGGFPFDQSTLKRLQEALFEHIRTFALQLGCQDTGNYIIYGCNVVGANITAGAMFIDGEICPFSGAVGDSNTTIKKQTNISNAAFENGTNPPVFIETIAVVDATGTKLSDFTKFNFVNDAGYVHTDNNFTALLLAKLNGIEADAEVNVQSDWNTVNSALDSFIKNKPIIEDIMRSGELLLGDFPNAQTQRITIPFPAVDTTAYKARVYIKSNSIVDSAYQDAISHCTSEYKLDSFDLIGVQHWNLNQNITIFYEIVRL